MAIRPKEQIGCIDCYSCAREVPVKKGESGTLSFPCPWCDFPGYAKAGTEALAIAMKRMRPMAAPVDPAPKKAPTKTIFG